MPDVAQAGYFRTYDRRRVRYAVFPCGRARPRGTIVLLHGRNEMIEKYFETIAELTAMGFWVATFDWRGQGGSERLLSDPLKGYVRRFTDYELDLERFIEHVVLPDTRLPFYLLAHSTGGLVALSAAPGLSTRIERMVLTAPFVALAGQAVSQRRLALLMRIGGLTGFATLPVGSHSHPAPFGEQRSDIGRSPLSAQLRNRRERAGTGDRPTDGPLARRGAEDHEACRPAGTSREDPHSDAGHLADT